MTKKEHEKDHHDHHHEPFFGGKTLTGILIVVFLILLSIGFIVPSISSTLDTNEIRIAVLIPLSGDTADYASMYKEGIDLAVEEQQKNGKNVIVTYYDTCSDASTALDQYFLAVENGEQIFFGPFLTREAEYVAPYAEIYKTVLLTPVTGASISDYSHYVFRFLPSNYYSGNALVTIGKENNITNLTILWSEDILGKTTYDMLEEYAKEEGMQVTGIPISSYEEVIHDLNNSSDKLIYVIPKNEVQFSELISAIAANNLSLLSKTYIVSDDGFGDPVKDNPYAFGINVLVPSISTTDPVFLQAFKEKYGYELNTSHGFAIYGYDGINTLVDIMAGKEKTGPEVADKLKEYRKLGITGAVVFDKALDRLPSYEIYDSELGTWGKMSLFASMSKQNLEDVQSYKNIKMQVLETYHSGNETLAREIKDTYWT